MTPNPMIVRAYIGRGARLWLLTRMVVGAVLLFGSMDPIELTTSASFTMVILTVFVVGVEMVKRRELVLLGNLGVSSAWLAAFSALPAIAGELLLRMMR
jgi:hypothetical protein